ncbi:hypothetical protein QBC38DRAFT_531122 [Podospora fimiseda]|uniref:Uncharacterized protein n=1 Tax=Podospora fimiseda TaxID=252190 RepID=A0AAN7BKQ3_9PEZI|nr:hypothetical protein QBC38DRAFT_531122 [Podospora fimiseda]
MKPNFSRNINTRFPLLRPLVDEIQEPVDPPSNIVADLDSDLNRESNRQRLSRPEIKWVATPAFQDLVARFWRCAHLNRHLVVCYRPHYANFRKELPHIQSHRPEHSPGKTTITSSQPLTPTSNGQIFWAVPGVIQGGYNGCINFINSQRLFYMVGSREVSLGDMPFILRIVKLDPRDSLTAEELLADPWFNEESPDTGT